MTPQDKIKALAEMDGLNPKIVEGLLMAGDGAPIQNYLASYDAIIPLIQKQTYEVKHRIWASLKSQSWTFDATPTQLADALLIATGKMKK